VVAGRRSIRLVARDRRRRRALRSRGRARRGGQPENPFGPICLGTPNATGGPAP